MHELGVVFEVVKKVESIAIANGVTQIDTIVLQIGELSSMIPKYIESCFPAAVDGTMMQDTKLKIEILPGNALCKSCNKVFNLIEHKGKCPLCGGDNLELISGKAFMIKEIIAR